MNTATYEVNFDGIVGPTHNYSGLSYGNIASTSNQYAHSNPREAALQGLKKMKFMLDLGLKQAVLPPHERPHLPSLRSLGFQGTNKELLASANKACPDILYAISSAASMWTANAATVSPSADNLDQKLHLTVANLTSKFHRFIESGFTQKVLEKIFADTSLFTHHPPLPPSTFFADEGAANHCRFCKTHGSPGVQLFIYGRHAFQSNTATPKNFPARQTSEASQAIARLHLLANEKVCFAQQHPDAIDAGAFHNDVMSVSNANLFFFHEKAFINQTQLLKNLKNQITSTCGIEPIFLEVKSSEITLEQAVNTYLFNSQIVTLPSQKMAIIAPKECDENPHTKTLIDRLIADPANPIQAVHYLDLKQSMRNGGGPACLRLRIVLTQNEIDATLPSIFLNNSLYEKLCNWVKKHYRDRLLPTDLADPQLLLEVYQALDELTQILKLGPIYDFQKGHA